jgi:hypothetical protein
MSSVSTAVAHPPFAAVRRRFFNFYTGLPIAIALTVFVGPTC